MDPTRWRRIEALLDEASGVAPEAREAVLDAGCRDADGVLDQELLDEVRRLTELEDEASDFFGDLPGDALGAHNDGALDSPALDDMVGRHVGRYRVEERVGTGGMGAVYRAVRTDGTFSRPVAIKVVRPGLAAEVGPHFRREQRLLGSLNHPHVARLLDSGTLPDGRPWLAMEFVQGEPITAYADRQKLGIDARLRLFLQVCGAVAYAHRQLVVHRDLKPSNVLVSEDARGEPLAVLLDFGIATLVREDGEAATQTGRTLLTPAYAAPEQICDAPASTATDVYALGALLYELLSGTKTVVTSNRPAHEVAHAVLEETPPFPSAAFLADASGARGLTPMRLSRRLRGDLDRIVMMALRKEPDRRYSTVEAFARDVRSHLEGHTIDARPDTLRYRLVTFVRRNRVQVAAGAIALFALVSGAGLALWQAQEARAESARANAETERAVQVSAFMMELLGDFDPSRSGGGQFSADSVLSRAAEHVRNGLDAHPDVRAQLLASLGQIHQSYAQFDQADSLLTEAFNLRRATLGVDHPDVATSLRDLAWLAYVRGSYDRADALYSDALTIHRAALGPDNLDVAADLEGLGLVFRIRGEPETALRYLREALAIREKVLPEDDERVVSNLNTMAYVLYNLQRYKEAEPIYRRVIALRRRSLGDHVQTAQALNDYAALLLADDRPTESVAMHREALVIRRALLGENHPHVAQSLSQIGWALQTQERYAEAEPFYRKALTIRQKTFGDDHLAVANSLLMLGEVRALRGATDEGLAMIARGVRGIESSIGAETTSAALARLRYAEKLADAGRTAQARSEARTLAPVLREAYEPGSLVLDRLAALNARLQNG